MVLCLCTTKAGTRCKLQSQKNSEFCHLHKNCNNIFKLLDQLPNVQTQIIQESDKIKLIQKPKKLQVAQKADKIKIVQKPKKLQLAQKPEKLQAVQKSESQSVHDALKDNLPQLAKKYKLDDFQLLKKLGEGAFGVVYSAINKTLGTTGTTLVIKVIPKNKTPVSAVMKEVNILSHLQPYCKQYILCYEGFFEDEKNSYIMTEFLGNYIQLYELKGVSENRRAMIVSNLVNGLKEIHKNNIVHRDIKPENIMVSQTGTDIKYIDFGLSCFEETCDTKIPVGTPVFIAPEIFLRVKPIISLRKADIWSLGITIYEFATDKEPFSNWEKTHTITANFMTDLKVFLKTYQYNQDTLFNEITIKEKIWSDIYKDNNMNQVISIQSMLVRDPDLRHL